MPDKPSWETFFDAHAPLYMENVFTKSTLREADFLVSELALPPGAAILDVGCGTGRHSVELARRGYRMTGLDLSQGMLDQAAQAAEAAGVKVEWVRADASRFSLPAKFDAAIGLCEGAVGLLGQGDDPIEQPLGILRGISRCLKPGAKAVLNALSAARLLRLYQDKDVAEGRFDPLTLVEKSEMAPREGFPPVPTRERAFTATELVLLLRLAGLSVLNVWGGTAGSWGKRTLLLDEYELMVVARKTGEPI